MFIVIGIVIATAIIMIIIIIIEVCDGYSIITMFSSMFDARFGDFDGTADQGIGKSALGVEFLHFAAAPGRHFSSGRSECFGGLHLAVGGNLPQLVASLMHSMLPDVTRKMMINPLEFRGNDLLHPNLRDMFAEKDRWRQSAVSKIDTSVGVMLYPD